jgi:hypothetical protein
VKSEVMVQNQSSSSVSLVARFGGWGCRGLVRPHANRTYRPTGSSSVLEQLRC